MIDLLGSIARLAAHAVPRQESEVQSRGLSEDESKTLRAREDRREVKGDGERKQT